MAVILLVGSDATLLEGLAQSLSVAGHRVRHAPAASEGVELALADRPLVVIVDRRSAVEDRDALRIPFTSGGAVLLCHREGEGPPDLPSALSRLVLADLALPLERNRLLALVHRVADRARITGRESGEWPALPEPPAPM